MPDRVRRVPLAPKVHAFQAEVGRNQRLIAPRQAHDGAIIANADPGARGQPASLAANASNELSFLQRQTPSRDDPTSIYVKRIAAIRIRGGSVYALLTPRITLSG